MLIAHNIKYNGIKFIGDIEVIIPAEEGINDT